MLFRSEVDWATLERKSPSTRTERYRELEKFYDPMMDSLMETEDEIVRGGEPQRYLFIEEGNGQPGDWFHPFENLVDANDHYRSDYEPDQWVVKRVVDLDTGLDVEFEIGFNFTFPKEA